MAPYDAVVVGSGPNGLAAAITIARTGRQVLVIEGQDTIGGGTRSAELTLPGFVSDVCSAVHPLGMASPFFRGLPLHEHGLAWIHPDAPLAHPLDDGPAVLLERSLEATAQALDEDTNRYRRLMAPLVRDWDKLVPELLKPLGIPRNPLPLIRFGPLGMQSAMSLARSRFRGVRAQALFAGSASHAIFPLQHRSSAGFGLMLCMSGHAVGWP
ncbi:MAG: phytoene desaturase family protein, partial [Anaerolineae bacterium]